jgi:hypothetical protein
MVLGSGIRDPRSGILDPEKTYSGSRIPNPGVKKHPIPDPGSGSATLSIRTADDSSVPFCYFNSSSLSAVANYDLRCMQFVDPACNDFRVLQLRWENLNQNLKMKKFKNLILIITKATFRPI